MANLALTATTIAADPTPSMQLPAGHPTISRKTPASPASMPANAIGTLWVRGVQRSAAAALPANDKVIIHFYQDEKIVKHAQGTLDDQGQTQITGIELTPTPIQALVMVQHGPITYRAISPSMDSANPQAQVEVPVYETTKTAPAWRVPMRHVSVSHSDKGLHVIDMLVVNNPDDRTWIGSGSGEDEGATLTIRLPEGAADLELGNGFGHKNVHLHGNMLLNIAPMVPGNTRYEFAYTLPNPGGKLSLPVTAPADTQQLVVMVPEDAGTVDVMGLTAGETRKTDEGNLRMFQTAGLPAGQSVSLTISGMAASAGDSTGASGSMSAAQIAAIAGLAVVLVGGAAFMLFKPARKTNA